VAVTKASELFGINRKDMEASFDQPFDNRAPWYFDGHGYSLRLSRRQGAQPVRQLRQTHAIMVYDPFTHPATGAVEHTDLMLL
jgi:hypothetical protein